MYRTPGENMSCLSSFRQILAVMVAVMVAVIVAVIVAVTLMV